MLKNDHCNLLLLSLLNNYHMDNLS